MRLPLTERRGNENRHARSRIRCRAPNVAGSGRHARRKVFGAGWMSGARDIPSPWRNVPRVGSTVMSALPSDSVAQAHYFCANPSCTLHIPDGHDGMGYGNWAELHNGCIVGRTRVNGRTYCDPCARQLLGSAVVTTTFVDEARVPHA